jgi:Lrp/AsnC family transcriptional regulator
LPINAEKANTITCELARQDVVVFAAINLTSSGRQNLLAFEQEIVRHPEVMECYTMTGIRDCMIRVVTRDIRHCEGFVRSTLTASPSIRELHSPMAVTEIKNMTELPLDTPL